MRQASGAVAHVKDETTKIEEKYTKYEHYNNTKFKIKQVSIL